MAEVTDLTTKDPNLNMRGDLLNVAGRVGLKQFSGFIYEEWLPELQGERGRRVIREMRDQDAVINGVLFGIEMLIRKAQWRIQPYDKSSQAADDAELVWSSLHDMEGSLTDKLSEILSFLWYGWAYFEMTYKLRHGRKTKDPTERSLYNDGLIGWRDWPIRSQESILRWEFDKDSDDLMGLWQTPAPDFNLRYVPYLKSLLFRTQVYKGNPEGRSALRGSYESYYTKKHLQRIEAIGIERDLAGLPMALVPPELLATDATDGQRALLTSIKKIVTNIRRDEQEGIVFPLAFDEAGHQIYDLKLLSTGGRRQFDTSAIIQRYDLRIAMSLLSDFILMGHEQVGSYALSDNKTGLFSTAIGSWLDGIAEVINLRAIPQLMEVNGRDVDRTPKLFHGDVARKDLTELGMYLQQVAPILGAALQRPEVMAYIMEQADLPVPSQSDLQDIADDMPDLIGPNSAQAEGATTSNSNAKKSKKIAKPKATGQAISTPQSQTNNDPISKMLLGS